MKNYARGILSDIFRIMKYTSYIFLIVVLSSQLLWASSSNGQTVKDVRIDITLQNKSLKEAFSQISKKGGFEFIYNEGMVKPYQEVNISAKNKTIADILGMLLLNTRLDYKEQQDKIIVIEKPVVERPITIPVTGKVVDEKGSPLFGATVSIKGTAIGTRTDENGVFKLDVADKKAIIVVSYIGYQKKEIAVNDQTTFNIALAPLDNKLNDVVVTSFGIKQQQKALGYATSTISAKDITEAGSTNFASALYGKAAGVIVRTQPGGASSGVSIQIRGINSINYNQPPLYVVDGVIIRNQQQYGQAGFNNNGFYTDQRIEGNGILDINPDDIETINILKGGSATALYGSDGESGVIVITTKKGVKGKGPTVDFNYYGTEEQAAFLPNYQNVYGQGYPVDVNLEVGASADGTFPDANSPSGWRPNFRAYADFGPKMLGQKVQWWDGSIQSYSPQPNNYKDIFRTGFSSSANVSLSNKTENSDYRISYTRLDYDGIQRESGVHKNTFGLNSSLLLSKGVSVDLVANYVNTITDNRPYQTNRLADSFDGFFGREEHMGLVEQKYLTSDGFEYVPYNQTQRNPAEAFVFNVRPNLYDYFFSTLKDQYTETENRLYSSATLNWEIIKDLKLRLRMGNDYTARNTDAENYNNYPVAFNTGGTSTGAYNVTSGIYSILYGDALLSYSKKINKDFSATLTGGFTARHESYLDQASGTTEGLVAENFFSLSNSTGILSTSYQRQYLIKKGTFGLLDLSFKDYLFLEAAYRQEVSSTLPPQNNTYYYPAINGSFVFSDLLRKSLPAFLSYGKLRLSYTQNGNPAPIYASNIAYSQTSLQTINGSVPQLSIPSAYGNNTLQPERKHEYEIGTELRFLNDRLGADVSFYTNKITNQILGLTTAPSNGAASQIVNVGTIGTKGLDVALNATPILTGNFKWDLRLNYSFFNTKVYALAPDVKELIMPGSSFEGGAIKIVARPGEELGNIYAYPIQTLNGKPLVDANGYYDNDQTRYVKSGNINPKAAGGVSNTFTYKSFSLTTLVDYRFGGQLISTPLKYGINAGMYTSTLKYRDTQDGGLTYYTNANGVNVQLPSSATSGPTGQTVYHDGLIQSGVLADGKANNIIISAADYYFNQFDAGDPNSVNQGTAIYNNSYVKLREVALGYNLPKGLVKNLGLSKVRFSLIGRNLLYIYRTLKNLDPETTLGNQWYNQGIDNGSIPSTRSYGFSLNATF
ncbi:SusC/RagA family TonB-linked outer membrane protein [Mucilaginibacter sp. X5P1]|uniref:SusC/RagA family TonB-linked outer membrane protein n=1 Tax=Mucilaginibacter sp. X5P1 TaxID=2723088 RepID=UPI00161B757A|nr:SusC/RagA family TonB-linked outer membrane protein [Mucilaginibacter sp. X5P1]MBB6141779.1 iron complex outermembrane receptor protein [Mucilaginibacter sp. X5P1]